MSDEEVDEENATAQLVVDEYARSKGMPVEEARKRYLPVVRARAKNPLVARTMEAVQVLSQIKSANEGADPTTRDLLSKLAGTIVGQSLGSNQGSDTDETMGDVTKYVMRIKAIDAAFGSGDIGKVKEELTSLKAEIQNKKKSEEIQGLMDKMVELVSPLREELNTLKTRNSEDKEEGETAKAGLSDPETLFTKLSETTDKAKEWLGRAGYKVEMDKGLSREEIEKMIEEAQKEAIEKLPPDELKNRLQKAGYKVVGGPMTYEETQKLVEEAVAKTQEAALDDKRISAVENIIRDSIAQVIEMFKKPMEGYFATMLQSRQSGEPPAPAPAE